MSKTDLSKSELVEAMTQDPDDFIRKHRELLEEIRDETDSDRIAAAIEAVLEDLEVHK